MNGLGRLVLTLAIGILGGFVFTFLALPAPWLGGATMAVRLAAVAGVPVHTPPLLRTLSLLFFGTVMGATVTPQTFADLPDWPVSLIGLFFVVFTIILTASVYLHRIHGFDADTAQLACIPGSMAYVVALAGDRPGVDRRQVAAVQIIRFTTLLMTLPFILGWLGYAAVDQPLEHGDEQTDLARVGLLFAIGIAGGLLGRRIGLPAGAMTGAMLAAGAASGAGFVTVRLPEWLLSPGFVIMGAITGASFAGADRRFLLAQFMPSLGTVTICSLIALLFAVPVAWMTDAGLAQIWLAYSPGGADTMAILALALGLEPTFVAAHHVIRLLGLGALVPVWLRFDWPRRN